VKLIHEPSYGQFYLQDPHHFDGMATAGFTGEDLARRFHCGAGIITVFVVSEFSPITIEVEIMEGPSHQLSTAGWDRIVECPLKVSSSSIVCAACPDGPEYGTFGTLPCMPGNYAVRIHYGGQHTHQDDGHTSDFYRIELWKSPPFQARELFLRPLPA